MLRKPTLFIFCGLPFSGKTTLANELVKRFSFVRVDLDEINSERGLGYKSKVKISSEDWRITYAESYIRTDKALSEEKTVINDTTNFTRQQREKLRAIANKYKIISKVIYFNIVPN